MPFKILIIDDDANMCQDEGSFGGIHYLRIKGSYSFEGEYAKLESLLLQKHGSYTVDIACDIFAAQKALGMQKYDLVYLDGGFDSVLDYLADLSEDRRPTYLIPVSSSFSRNNNIRQKLVLLSGITEPDWQTKESLGIETIF